MKRINNILSHSHFKRCIQDIETYEINRTFCCHGLNHLLDTARIAYILSLENNINISKDLIYATALLHDLGRYDEYIFGTPHNHVSDKTIKILADCGYSTDEIAQIIDAIQYHRCTSNSVKSLSDVISKADKLSRLCFNCSAKDECYWHDDKKNHELYI